MTPTPSRRYMHMWAGDKEAAMEGDAERRGKRGWKSQEERMEDRLARSGAYGGRWERMKETRVKIEK